MKETNIHEIRGIAIEFLYLDLSFNEKFSFLCTHPYFDTVVTYTPKGKLIDLRNEEDLKQIREIYVKMINESDLTKIIIMIRAPYRFAFLKYAKQYMSKMDFDKWLAACWVDCENPNQDKNVDIPTFISWFKKADKRIIMSDEDYKVYESLPDVVEIYRGVAVGRAEQKGLSWTCEYETAKWFSERFDSEKKHGYILKGKVKKGDVLAYFNMRGEDELLCNSKKVYDLERIL